MNRSTRTLIAITLWLLAGFIGVNNIVLSAGLGEWLLPLILFTIGLVLTLYPEGPAALETHETDLLPAPAAHAPLPAPAVEKPAHTTVVEHQPAPAPAPPPPPPPPAPAARSGPDDLTVIEGIGPKMSAALIAAGIDTYEKLASTSEDDLREAIRAQGMRFAPSIPTWAAQAAYAARGDFDGLSAYQSSLGAGRGN
jgi:predicted flap endonuclease-1-like 5' DNA nuclease